MTIDSVLIVDDSLTVRMELADAFEASGFRVRRSATLGQARQALSDEPADVIVLDVVLPDGDGVDFLNEIRAASGPPAAVLMLSSEADVKDRIRGLRTGADEYVGKPFDTTYVVAKAQEILRLRRTALPGGRPTVLVIDDSMTFREELRDAFERADYAVVVAASGEEGLRVAADQRPQAVVVDGVLPGIDGATVIRRLRLDAVLRGVPCLLLTASEDYKAELRALDSGADGFVRKEEGVDVILARLAATLRGTTSAAPGRETASLLGPKRILAVDDSPTYLEELAATLREEGYDVVLARSGEEALDLLAVQPADCILLDLLMPGLSGQETCQRIKSAPGMRDIPLIILTASEDRAAMLESLGVGADDYIQKSHEFEVLKARVRAQLRRKQFEDENRCIREQLLRAELEAAEARAARELAATRAALLKELEDKNHELVAFSYSVSHDLRAPLRTIDGVSAMMLEDCELDATGKSYVGRVRAAAQRMTHLIEAMLMLGRVSQLEFERTRVDLSALAHLIVAELQRHDPDRTVEVHIQHAIVAEADRRLVEILLDNLLGNSWKFTSKTERASIEFGAEDSTDGPVYFVRDNGAGFDMAFAEKLFGPFQRFHGQADFPGTGVGLTTVQRVVHRHGGRVWAHSQPGAGTTFRFTLEAPQSTVGEVRVGAAPTGLAGRALDT